MTHVMLRTVRPAILLPSIAIALLINTVAAHDHHSNKIVTGEFISKDPIDSILWIHILLQTFTWGVLFPIGMVLGMVKSRWHVPLQITSTALAIVGYFLGHAHKGRQFTTTAHGAFAKILHTLLASQVIFGIYLKLHWEKGVHGRLRPWIVRAHGIVGKAMPVAAWVQMLFGGIAALGFCRADHLGQCLAHFIMGSAFIAYGILLTILLLVGQNFMRKIGKSQEFFDSAVIAAWGCVNTFTEHRWGHEWAHNDIQHTSMGVIWWCAGLLGMWLSRGRGGAPKRNLIPSLVIILTGWAMSSHPQHLMISTMTHAIFGYTLMAAGLARMIEISFVLKDKSNAEEANSFSFLPPFLLCAGGFLFMGATEEQMVMLDAAGIDHVSWILVLYSVAFLLYLYANVLIQIFASNNQPKSIKLDAERGVNGHANGYANGHVNGRPNGHLARDAEEFELSGLTDDDDSDEEERLLKEQKPIPS